MHSLHRRYLSLLHFDCKYFLITYWNIYDSKFLRLRGVFLFSKIATIKNQIYELFTAVLCFTQQNWHKLRNAEDSNYLKFIESKRSGTIRR